MTRSSLGNINPATTSGTTLAAMLSARDLAENSGHAGGGRPDYATTGMLYTDDSYTPPRLFMASPSGTPDVDLSVLFGDRPGTLRATAEVRLPTGWLWADGSAKDRSTYSILFDAICPSVTGNTVAGTTVSDIRSPSTGLPEDLTGLGLIGAKIEGANIPAGATITAISTSTITLSVAASGAATATPLRILPHGTSSGTTFNLPNAKGRVVIGRDDMNGTPANIITVAGSGLDGTKLGALGGAQSVLLTTTHLPGHAHTASSSATFVSGTGTGTGTTDTSATHDHTDSFAVAAGGAHAHTYTVHYNATDSGTGVVFAGNSSGVNENRATSTAAAHTHGLTGKVAQGGAHSHVVTVSSFALSTLVMTVTTTVNSTTGGDQAHINVQPTLVENVIIKF